METRRPRYSARTRSRTCSPIRASAASRVIITDSGSAQKFTTAFHVLEVWPESHWPGFALRQTDVL